MQNKTFCYLITREQKKISFISTIVCNYFICVVPNFNLIVINLKNICKELDLVATKEKKNHILRSVFYQMWLIKRAKIKLFLHSSILLTEMCEREIERQVESKKEREIKREKKESERDKEREKER